MSIWRIIGCVVAGLVAANVLLTVLPRFFTLARRVPRGRRKRGLVVFAESIRWLGVAWGQRTVAEGLRRAGFEGEFRYWRWHAWWRGWLVLPAIMDAGMLEREAHRLAEFLRQQRREHPDAPLYVIGYSAGGYLALRALELLEEGVHVDAAAVLAGALAPSRDLAPACRRVVGPMVVCSSLLDCFIVGLGTLLFGTADRRHTPSMGMLGPRPRVGLPEQVKSIPWRPGLARRGHWGGHFGASAAGFIQHAVAPAMGLAPPGPAPAAPHPPLSRLRRVLLAVALVIGVVAAMVAALVVTLLVKGEIGP